MKIPLSKLVPKNPRLKRAAAGGGFLLAAVLMSASIFATGPDAEPEVRQEKAWPVSTVEVSPATLSPSFRAYGRVESSHVAHLRTDLNAPVAEVHVKEGAWVQAGETLVSLDDRELRLELAQRQANLKELSASLRSIELEQQMVEQSTPQYTSMRTIAQHKLERHRNLMERRLISQSLLDEVTAAANQAEIDYQDHMRALADFPNRIAAEQAAIERADALVAEVELDLERSVITAPFTGPVLAVHVAPGDRSVPGAPLVDVADASAFEVRVQVPDTYSERFHAGQAVTRSIVARTDTGLSMPLSRLSSQVRQGQSGLDAFFDLQVASGDPETALGRMIELSVVLPAESQVVALPVQSLYENDRVYAVKALRLEAIKVERVGELTTDAGEYRVLVRSPMLHSGQQVITTQLPRAISGLLVEPA
jgi:multidrug resistance efflux pump